MNLLIQSMSSISPQLDQFVPITKKINALEVFTTSMDSDFDWFATSFKSMSSVIEGLSQQLQEIQKTTSELSSQQSNTSENKVPKSIPSRTFSSTHMQTESPMIYQLKAPANQWRVITRQPKQNSNPCTTQKKTPTYTLKERLC